MASGLFFDPRVALTAAPLISSTCTLLFAWDQTFFLSLLNQPQHRTKTRPMLRGYFESFFYRATSSVCVFIALTSATCVANLYTQPLLLRGRGSYKWYMAGAALAAGHLVFVPAIAPSCKALVEAGEDTDTNGLLDGWLSINTTRLLTVDVAAWAAILVGCLKTLRV